MSWYIDVLTNNYLNFNGRARRTEFWMFALVHLIVIGILSFIGLWPFIIYFLLTVIPAFSSAFSADFPVTFLFVKSIKITWVSVPPDIN